MGKRCFACMTATELSVCPKCGFDNLDLTTLNPSLLKPGNIIKARYLVGMPLEQNGESVSYIGYDMEQNERVRIKEFFPDTLCRRKENTNEVFCNAGMEIQYRSLMTDFVELTKQLIAIMANSCLLKAKELLSDNNTIYAVYEDCVGIKLTKYLRDNAGELSWEETENLFLPLLYTVKLLNSSGIIHRGISPETIIVTKNRELKLWGVCTSAVRAINTEVTPELFSGYAAPEQYQKCTSHGEWTDVYSVSAVLYRTLTGTMPPSAETRTQNEVLIKPKQLNPNIQKSVSDAIANGLAYNKGNRTLYIKDLIGELYAAPQNPDMIDIHAHEQESEPRHSRFRVPIWLIVVLVTLPIMLVLFFVAYNFVLGGNPNNNSNLPSSEIASEMPSSEPSSMVSSDVSSSVPQVVVEDFVGKVYEDIASDELYSKMFKFKPVIEEYSDTIDIGYITKQDIEKNKVVAQGAEIQLTVSKGLQLITMPPLVDNVGEPVAVEAYKKFLIDSGFEVKVEFVTSMTTIVGRIDSISEAVGIVVDRDKVKAITIYVADANSLPEYFDETDTNSSEEEIIF